MLSYLRLFFSGALLLFVLGLYNGQNSQSEVSELPSNGFEQTQNRLALLPFDPVPSGSIQCPCQNSPQASLNYIWQKQKTDLSNLSNRRIHLARKIVDAIRPDLLSRTGSKIYCRANPDIPS